MNGTADSPPHAPYEVPDGWQFSQSSLQDYADCPRRFLLRYRWRMRWPALVAEPAEQYEANIARGERFHRMVQQFQAGVPAERVPQATDDVHLQAWWSQFLAHGLNGLPERRYVEMTLYTHILGHPLVAKYDLIALEAGDRAVILDWKTGPRRPKREALARRWQGIVYPYVLVEAGAALNGGRALDPERVEMVYWFANDPEYPERFAYGVEQHARNRVALETLIHQVRAERSFPLTPDLRMCRYCAYRSYCDRGDKAGAVNDLDNLSEDDPQPNAEGGPTFDFDQIAETEF
jgi:hypothetical protein